MDALVGLGFKKHLEGLKKSHAEYLELRAERLCDISKRPTADKKAVAKKIHSVFRLAFDQINHYQDAFKDINYQPLISEINVMLTGIQKEISMRTTINKKKAQKKKKKAAEAASTGNEHMKDEGVNKSGTELESETTNNESHEPNNLPAKIEKGPDGMKLKNWMNSLKANNGKEDNA